MTENSTADDTVRDDAMASALRWQAALDRPNADWDAFTDWLESDPDHAQAMAALDDIDASFAIHREGLGDLVSNPVEPPARIRFWPRWHWPAIAAALAFALIMPFAAGWLSPSSTETYRADAGQPVAIALESGSNILLARQSSLSVDRKAHSIELASGSALFDVRHNPDRTLLVKAGEWEVRDIGTQFSVTTGPAGLTVAVAEGSVSVRRISDDPAAAINVSAGKRLVVLANTSQVTLSSLSADAIAGWREGRLTYDAMPIEMVAQDIARYLGKPVTIDPALAKRKFSGTLVGDNGEQLIAGLEAIMAIDSRDEGSRVVLVDRSD